MTQNIRSASPADPARLKVRSFERTFTSAPQPQVTHQLNRASGAHPGELRTDRARPLRTSGRDDFHGVPDFSAYATRPQESLRSSKSEPALTLLVGQALHPALTILPGKNPVRTFSSFTPHHSSFPFQPSPNPPGTAIFGFVRVSQKEFFRPLAFLSPRLRASACKNLSTQSAVLKHPNRQSKIENRQYPHSPSLQIFRAKTPDFPLLSARQHRNFLCLHPSSFPLGGKLLAFCT